MATKAERIIELETEIAEITIAISHIRKGGQAYEITTASGAGTKRIVTQADYKALIEERNSYKAELQSLNGTGRGVRIGLGW